MWCHVVACEQRGGDGGNVPAIDGCGGRGGKRVLARAVLIQRHAEQAAANEHLEEEIRPQHGVWHTAGSERGLDLEVRGVRPAALVLDTADAVDSLTTYSALWRCAASSTLHSSVAWVGELPQARNTRVLPEIEANAASSASGSP